MANHLKMAQVQAIQALRARGWSFRRIGRELGVHRETAARHVRLAEAESRQPHPSGEASDQNRPNPPAGSALDAQCQGYSGPVSLCEPFREVIIEDLGRGLSCQRIWQDL